MGLAEKSDAWKTPSVNIIPKDHQTSAGSPLGGSKSVVWALLYGNWSWGGNPLALHCNCKANMFYLEILGSFLRSDEIWAQHFGKVTMEAFVERNPDCKKQLSDRGLYFETTWEVTSSNPIKFTLRPCSNPCQVWWTCQSHFGMMSWTSSSLQKLLSDTRMFFFSLIDIRAGQHKKWDCLNLGWGNHQEALPQDDSKLRCIWDGVAFGTPPHERTLYLSFAD